MFDQTESPAVDRRKWLRFAVWAVATLCVGLIVSHYAPAKLRYVPAACLLLGPVMLFPLRRARA